MKFIDLIGKRFGRLVVIGRAKDRYTKNMNKVIYYLCLCDCGNKKEIRGTSLRRKDGPTTSCGCLRVERMKLLLRERNPNWRGGKRVESGGYIEVYLPNHPNARQTGYVKEHRVIMEEKLGRYLLPEENVHHINGNKIDNCIENLELWSISQPCGQRVEDKIAWAKRMLKIYE